MGRWTDGGWEKIDETRIAPIGREPRVGTAAVPSFVLIRGAGALRRLSVVPVASRYWSGGGLMLIAQSFYISDLRGWKCDAGSAYVPSTLTGEGRRMPGGYLVWIA